MFYLFRINDQILLVISQYLFFKRENQVYKHNPMSRNLEKVNKIN